MNIFFNLLRNVRVYLRKNVRIIFIIKNYLRIYIFNLLRNCERVELEQKKN